MRHSTRGDQDRRSSCRRHARVSVEGQPHAGTRHGVLLPRLPGRRPGDRSARHATRLPHSRRSSRPDPRSRSPSPWSATGETRGRLPTRPMSCGSWRERRALRRDHRRQQLRRRHPDRLRRPRPSRRVHPAAVDTPGLGGVFARRNWAQVGAQAADLPGDREPRLNEDQPARTSPETCPTSKTDPGTSTFLTNWPQDRAVTNSNGRLLHEALPERERQHAGRLRDRLLRLRRRQRALLRAEHQLVGQNIGHRGPEYPNDYVPTGRRRASSTSGSKNDLKAHQGHALKFAFFHYPLYSDDHNEPSDPFLARRRQPRPACSPATACSSPSTATRTAISATSPTPTAC